MEIKFEILEVPDGVTMTDVIVCFSESGGSIGRKASNDLCLPDPDLVVSSLHANIECDGVHFSFLDVSTNGTYLNDSPEPIVKKQSQHLNSGDRLTIGSYVIAIEVDAAKLALPNDLDFVDFLDQVPKDNTSKKISTDNNNFVSTPVANDPLVEEPVDLLGGDHISSVNFLGETDPLKLISDRYAEAHEKSVNLKEGQTIDDLEIDRSSARISIPEMRLPLTDKAQSEAEPIKNHVIPKEMSIEDLLGDEINAGSSVFSPSVSKNAKEMRPKAVKDAIPLQKKRPRVAPHKPPLPKTLNVQARNIKESMASVAPTKSTNRKIKQAMRSKINGEIGQDQDIGKTLAKLLNLNHLTTDQTRGLPKDVSKIILMTVNALMQLLRARAELKNEFRLGVTMIAQNENNPLKFSVSPEQAMENMYRSDAGTLDPLDAIEDGLKDLVEHQLAIVAGMRAAFDGMMSYFEPENLKKHLHFDASFSFEKLLTGTQKARYWDALTKHHENLMADSDNTFRRLFSEEFGRVYELKLIDMKRNRKNKL